MARFVSFLVLVAILIVIAIIFYKVMAGFFVPLFLAAVLAVVAQPLYRWMLVQCRKYRYLAAGLATAGVALMVLLPIGLVVTTATLEGLSLLDQLRLGDVRTKLDELRSEFGLQIPRESDVRRIEVTLRSWREKQRKGEPLDLKREQVDNLLQRVEDIQAWIDEQSPDLDHLHTGPLHEALVRLHASEPESVERDLALADADAEFREFKRNLLGGTYRAWLTEWVNPSEEQVEEFRASVVSRAGPVLTIGGDTVVLLAKLGFGTLIMVVTLFFLLAEGSRMLEGVTKLLPLKEQHVQELATEFDRACRAIVSATLLSAIAQGLLAGIGFYACGLRSSVALLSVLTMVLAMVPFTGAAAVWIPVSLYLYFYQGSLGAAVGLAIYGTVVISAADNVIKPLVLHGQSNIHPLLALLSVLGGIQALGPIGIVVGPMAVVFLQVLLRLVQREMSSLDKSQWYFWRGLGTGGPATVVVAAPVDAAEGEAAVASEADLVETTTPDLPVAGEDAVRQTEAAGEAAPPLMSTVVFGPGNGQVAAGTGASRSAPAKTPQTAQTRQP